MGKLPVMVQDEILLKIKRKYSRDEEFKLVLQELSAAKQKLGECESEIEHLNFELNKKNETTNTPLTNPERAELKKLRAKNAELIQKNEDLRQELRKSEAGKNLIEKNNQLQRQIKEIRANNSVLITKLLAAEKKLSQYEPT